jgi:hypothetical protein
VAHSFSFFEDFITFLNINSIFKKSFLFCSIYSLSSIMLIIFFSLLSTIIIMRRLTSPLPKLLWFLFYLILFLDYKFSILWLWRLFLLLKHLEVIRFSILLSCFLVSTFCAQRHFVIEFDLIY